MKSKLTTVLVVVIFFAGLSLLLYPTISDYYNSLLHAQSIVDYADKVDKLEEETYKKLWQEAEEYNAALLERSNQFGLTEELERQYDQMLVTSNMNIMAYIQIPTINVTLPIGHGCDEDVLQKSVGHLEFSSLPVGGESTHCVLSGHRGLPSSELFTNIDHLELGDRFYIHVLGETLTYRVDNIAVVEPDDYSLLGIRQGKDYVTLVTCTPYGINSHRLLVRGVRLDTAGGSGTGDALVIRNEISAIDLMVVLPVALVALSAVVFVIVLLSGKKKKRKG